MSKSRTRVVAVTAASTGLVAGLALGVTGLASASTTTPTATTAAGASTAHSTAAHHHGDRDRRHREGDLVTDVTAGTLSLDTPSGQKTVVVTPATIYRRGGKTVTAADVKPNETVRIVLVDPTATAPVAKTVRIEMARAAGYVTVVKGTSSFTIVGPDGFARKVTESTATVYRNAGAAGSPSEVTVGRFVRATGTVAADGTTLDAVVVGTGEAPRKAAKG